MERVTHEDIARALQNALEKAQATAPEVDYSAGITSGELADYLGLSQTTARKLIKKGIGAGVVRYIGRAPRINMSEEMSKVQVYLPAPSTGAPKA